jgi:decaprenylphospho-beta-D-erythro-pentofuranosid-2-ulose 2-reductase
MNDPFGIPQSVVVLGGTSDIARAILGELVPRGCHRVVLAGRDLSALSEVSREVHRAGATHIVPVPFDATDGTDGADAERTARQCIEALDGQVDLVLVALGHLGEQARDETDPHRVAEAITVNFTWPAAALAGVARHLRAQGHGRIVVLSTVAGVRIRRANYLYGAAKAGLDGYARGLGETLRGSGVRVQVVRPGFVHSKMTAGLAPAPFASQPTEVAAAVVRGLSTNRPIIWAPAKLRWVFAVLGALPEQIWRRLPG